MEQCFICYEDINNEKLKCSCNIDTCAKCLKKWLFVNPDKDPNCPNCLKIIPIHNIYEMFDLSFLDGEYYDLRSELLFQKEQNYFIEDMDIVHSEIKRRQLQKQIRSLYSKKRQLKRMKKCLDEINFNIKELIDKKSEYIKIKKKESKQKKILIPCPKKQCRGMILDNCICCICELLICFDCLQEKKENHQCIVSDKETAIEIRRNTKPCPQCGVRIFKISGCDQMWCTQCHSTFSYETGKKLNQTMIHNPHYFEYIFNNNVNEQNDCERDFLNYVINRLNQNNNLDKYRSFIQVLLNRIYHFEHMILPQYTIDPLKTNADIRCKYLLKDIDKKDLKRLLYKREKRNLKKTAVYQVLQILIQTVKDCVLRLIHNNNENFQIEIKNIIHYTWKQGEQINKNYGGNINPINLLLTPYFGF
jgi:hypothetical protein